MSATRESPAWADTADNYSDRISGYLVPQVTGTYTFWLACDDDGQLRLSTDENPANVAQIASVTGFVAPEACSHLLRLRVKANSSSSVRS